MNVFSHIQRVTNVPKSHSTEYPRRIRLECNIVDAGEEPMLIQEFTRTLDLN